MNLVQNGTQKKGGDIMPQPIVKQTKDAIAYEKELVECFHKMLDASPNPKTKAIIHDLILMEEMNEVLLRSLSQSATA